jgi:hypothetical protein
MKTISAPSRDILISSLDSSADFFPTSGSEPAPNPPVIILPILILVGASELNNA